MDITPPIVSRYRSVDATGRAIPMTRRGNPRRGLPKSPEGLDALDDMGDEEEQRQTLRLL